MAEEHGDEYLEALSAFVEECAEGLLDGSVVLRLKPLGLLYLDSRFGALSELEALRADAPVDYLRAVVADLGDYRKLEKLRGFLRMLEKVKVAGANAPLRDSVPLRLSMLSGLRHLELHGCDLSTAAAQGLVELKPQLETLVCVDSTDSLADLLAERGAPLILQTPWSRLTRLACPRNHLRLMDPSLCSLPVADEIDLSRNNLTTVANLHICVRLTKLDLGFNSITSLVGLNRVVGAITQLILRGNGIHSLAGLEKLYAIEALDLAHNVIGSLSEVARLGQLPSLTRLWLEGNPIELRRNYRAEVLGLLQDGEKVKLDGRHSSTFERFAIRTQQRRNARAPRFPEPVYPSGAYVAAVESATSEGKEAHPHVHKIRPTRIAEPEIVDEAPDEDSRTPPKTACIMEHPEEDPERMFSVRALKHSPPTRVRSPLAEEASPPEATTSSAEEELAGDPRFVESVNRPPLLFKSPGSGIVEGFHTPVWTAEEGPSGGSTPRSVNRLPSPVADATPGREGAEEFHIAMSVSEDESSSSTTVASVNTPPSSGAEYEAPSPNEGEGIHTPSVLGAEQLNWKTANGNVNEVQIGAASISEGTHKRDPFGLGVDGTGPKLGSSENHEERLTTAAGRAKDLHGDPRSGLIQKGGYERGGLDRTGQKRGAERSALRLEEPSHAGTAVINEKIPVKQEERGRKDWVSGGRESEPPLRTKKRPGIGNGSSGTEEWCRSGSELPGVCQRGGLRHLIVRTAVETDTEESQKCLETPTPSEEEIDVVERNALKAKNEGAAEGGSLGSLDCAGDRDPALASGLLLTESAVKEQPKSLESPDTESLLSASGSGSDLLIGTRTQEASDGDLKSIENSIISSKPSKQAKRRSKARVVNLDA
ncbi:hypothetical protein KFL_003330070 [Klebsormidium nitens]|uniref:Uncharacterized protein n=1 Tax=Klebsormidium nitens TaxID=105231 RepID=A0A1Y1IEH6_KLENI|nr:hypothetical protein KFL_003330070 [Klebsormidium nitens]|eukprot:GAQ87126.1 hypothetical protein KFL_003330070 [Klebsormidium nitens]